MQCADLFMKVRFSEVASRPTNLTESVPWLTARIKLNGDFRLAHINPGHLAQALLRSGAVRSLTGLQSRESEVNQVVLDHLHLYDFKIESSGDPLSPSEETLIRVTGPVALPPHGRLSRTPEVSLFLSQFYSGGPQLKSATFSPHSAEVARILSLIDSAEFSELVWSDEKGVSRSALTIEELGTLLYFEVGESRDERSLALTQHLRVGAIELNDRVLGGLKDIPPGFMFRRRLLDGTDRPILVKDRRLAETFDDRGVAVARISALKATAVFFDGRLTLIWDSQLMDPNQLSEL